MEYYDQRKIILPVLIAGDLALASYHDLKGKMIMQVNMKKGNGKNSITSKQFNRGLIFQLIATGTCNTRIELSRRTGLAKTTVTNIVAEFMEKGIVKECEEELTEVCGRNPIILKVADQAPKIIGILVFRTNIQAVLCSLDMQIFRTETIEFGELTGRSSSAAYPVSMRSAVFRPRPGCARWGSPPVQSNMKHFLSASPRTAAGWPAAPRPRPWPTAAGSRATAPPACSAPTAGTTACGC